jgi:hypothetical protein
MVGLTLVEQIALGTGLAVVVGFLAAIALKGLKVNLHISRPSDDSATIQEDKED